MIAYVGFFVGACLRYIPNEGTVIGNLFRTIGQVLLFLVGGFVILMVLALILHVGIYLLRWTGQN